MALDNTADTTHLTVWFAGITYMSLNCDDRWAIAWVGALPALVALLSPCLCKGVLQPLLDPKSNGERLDEAVLAVEHTHRYLFGVCEYVVRIDSLQCQ